MRREYFKPKIEHIKGLSLWFWIREGFATANEFLISFWRESTCFEDFLFAFSITFILGLFIYTLLPLYTTLFGSSNLQRNSKSDCESTVYGKKSIEYFTIMEQIGGRFKK